MEYIVCHVDNARWIEVGRFCYRFDEQGESMGGWIKECTADWAAERKQWAALRDSLK